MATTTYEKIPLKTMVDALEFQLERNHARLAAVDIRLIPARGPVDKETGEPTGDPALKSKDQPIMWERKITSIKWRAADVEDVIIYIDADKWEELETPQRLAEMDKALASIKVETDDHGVPKVDDLNRPKLKTRNPDRLIEIYDDVVTRNGRASADVIAVEAVTKKFGQLFLVGFSPAANDGADQPPAVH